MHVERPRGQCRRTVTFDAFGSAPARSVGTRAAPDVPTTVGCVPLVAAAVCPHPPLVVPEVASGAAHELDDLRAACAIAIARLMAPRPDQILIVGSGPEPSGAELGLPDLPLSRAVGWWLLDRFGVTVSRLAGETVPPKAPLRECRTLGRDLAATAGRVALLVMGDGSARRGQKAPGYDDVRARPFDEVAAEALAAVDTRALLDIDPVLADDLWCAGRAPWQVLAAAAEADGRSWSGELLYEAAPYGVAYFVAHWSPTKIPPIMTSKS